MQGSWGQGGTGWQGCSEAHSGSHNMPEGSMLRMSPRLLTGTTHLSTFIFSSSPASPSSSHGGSSPFHLHTKFSPTPGLFHPRAFALAVPGILFPQVSSLFSSQLKSHLLRVAIPDHPLKVTVPVFSQSTSFTGVSAGLFVLLLLLLEGTGYGIFLLHSYTLTACLGAWPRAGLKGGRKGE